MKRLVFVLFLSVFCLSLSLLTAAEGEKKIDGVLERLNIVYKTVDGQDICLNLFCPTAGGEQVAPAPLLIDMISGGWVSGAPASGGFWRETGALEKGYAIASVSHRSVTPECVFPAQIEDVKAAVRFLRAHAEEYGLDPNRFAALGASSGGHMASMLGLSDEFREFDVGENLDQSSQIQVVFDLCCTADMEFYLKRSPDQVPAPVYHVLGTQKRTDVPYDEQAAPLLEKARKYSPITYVNANFSPTLILQGAQDDAVLPSQSCLFYEALKKVGVRTELYIDNTKGHTAEFFTREEKAKLMYDFLQKNQCSPK